jgi:hypothetical protein
MALRELAPFVLILVALIVGFRSYGFFSGMQYDAPGLFWLWSIFIGPVLASVLFVAGMLLVYAGGAMIAVAALGGYGISLVLSIFTVWIQSGFTRWMDTGGKLFACYSLAVMVCWTSVATGIFLGGLWFVVVHLISSGTWEITTSWQWSGMTALVILFLEPQFMVIRGVPDIALKADDNFVRGGWTDDVTHES